MEMERNKRKKCQWLNLKGLVIDRMWRRGMSKMSHRFLTVGCFMVMSPEMVTLKKDQVSVKIILHLYIAYQDPGIRGVK